MGEVKESTITVPAEYAERFRYETLFQFGTAGEQIDEFYTWGREAKERGKQVREIGPDELTRLHEAERIYVQAHEQDGELVIEAQAKTLSSAAHGCAMDAAEDIQSALQNLDGDYRSAADEVEFWQSQRERFDSVNGKVA